MKTMYLDTSSEILYFSFYDDASILYEYNVRGKNNHSENLIKELELALNKTSMKVSSFDRIVVGIGPGSYTGLRVALTVAKMFSYTNSIPLYTCSSLDILSSSYLDKTGVYAVRLHAKRGYVYGKIIEVFDLDYKYLVSDTFLTVDEFESIIKDYDYKLIDDSNYSFNPLNLQLTVVKSVHSLSPNYLQKGV